MNTSLLVLVSLVVVPFAAAQGSSPAGFDTVEANSNADVPFSHASLRMQQIDNSVRGSRMTIGTLAFRRDGDPFVPHRSPDRTVELSLWLGGGDAARFDPRFAANYRGELTQVFARQKVSLPEWRGSSPILPGEFDVKLPLPTAWGYDGRNDLLMEIVVHGNSSSLPMLVDADDQLRETEFIAGKGPGCKEPLTGLEMLTHSQVDNLGPGALMNMTFAVLHGPPGSLADILVGTEPTPPLPLPRPPCFPHEVRVVPKILFDIPLGKTSPAGTAVQSFPVKYSKNLIGLTLELQGWAIDPSLPYGIRLASNGTQRVPVDPPPAQTIMAWALAANAENADQKLPGGIVTLLR